MYIIRQLLLQRERAVLLWQWRQQQRMERVGSLAGHCDNLDHSDHFTTLLLVRLRGLLNTSPIAHKVLQLLPR